MTASETIQKVLNAKVPRDIFPPETDGIRKAYHEYAKLIHPDICKEPNAQDAFLQLKEFYEYALQCPSTDMSKPFYGQKMLIRKALDVSAFELGARYVTDNKVFWIFDAGKEKFRDNCKHIVEGMHLRLQSIGNIRLLDYYLPLVPDIRDTFTTRETGRLGIVVAKKPGEYPMDLFLKAYRDRLGGRDIAWIISRMIDLCCFLRWGGYPVVLNGFTEKNLFICPEKHSIHIYGGWWYATLLGERMIGTSREVYSLMSAQTKADMLATPLTDMECVRAISRRITEGKTDIPEPILKWIGKVSRENPIAEKYDWEKVLTDSYGQRKFIEFKADPNDIYTQKRGGN